jgi:desulfoferrodoxin-like iron-binding protein
LTTNQLVDYDDTGKVAKRWYWMANQIGKRYRCTKCGAELIVTKGGEGTIACCGQPMEQKK